MADNSGLAAVGFGLAASLTWGTSDFCGGLAARRAHVFGVMFGSYIIGLVPLLALALARSEPMASAPDLVWAGAAGIAGAGGIAALYRALAIGRMGIAAPLAAVLGAAIPVLFSAMVEGLPGVVQFAGFGIALFSVWLIARPQSLEGGSASGLGLVVMAGIGFGFFFILMGRVSEDAVFWPLTAARCASMLVVLIVVRLSRQNWQPPRSAWSLILGAGLTDVAGITFFLLAAQSGRLDVASVISSLYPAVTVILARGILKEELSRWQSVGILAALVAIPLIAA